MELTIQQTTIDTINHHHHAARNAAAQMAMHAALAGLELLKVKKDLGHGAFGAFLETLEFTDRTAQKYMMLAEGIRKRIEGKYESGSYLTLLDCAPSGLDKEQSDRLEKLLHKVTDGSSISQLYLDFGITKAPQGSQTTGGGPGGSKPRAALSLPEQEEALRMHAREQWALIDRGFFGYEDKFILLPRVDIEGQIALLEIQLQARKRFLAGAKPGDVTKLLKA